MFLNPLSAVQGLVPLLGDLEHHHHLVVRMPLSESVFQDQFKIVLEETI